MAAFMDDVDLTPFDVLPNQIPLDTLNPVATSRLERARQTAVARYFPHGPNQQPDTADPNLLDHAIWYANSQSFPGGKRILFPGELRSTGVRARHDVD